MPEGYYREYTGETPGSPDRGARRIVGGGDTPTDPDVLYYTADHYASFCEIAESGISESERLLPDEAATHYRVYTVPAPGPDHPETGRR
jgi:guanyl-specific ribonuclease Sa